jgi:proteasome assembly chaperone (PAC2) family protein
MPAHAIWGRAVREWTRARPVAHNRRMLTVHSQPELRAPVMLCGFSGWPDAGEAASGAIEYLVSRWAPRRFAEFESGRVYVQTTHRPESRLTGFGRRRLVWPNLALYALPVPYAPRDLILVHGAEPDLRWRGCSEAIVDLAERLGTTQVLTLGAYLAPVAHGGEAKLSGRASRAELRRALAGLGLRDSNYEGPTGFPTVLLEAAAKRGLVAGSVWAASPIYLRSMQNPKLSAALLSVVEKLLEVDLGLTELEISGRDLEHRVDEELAARPDLQAFVRRLAGADEDDDLSDIPDVEEMLDDLEQYLGRLIDDDDDDDDEDED